jgi:trimethylamine monooxygenase
MFRLWLNGPKELVEYVNYTIDDHFRCPTPSYQLRSVVYDYLIGRAKRNDIRKYIRFHTAVRHVDNQGEQFKVTVEDLIFDYVIVAPGRYSTPNMPALDEIQGFSGRVVHSKSFPDASEFVNQHVLIIASSYSTEDITLQLYTFGARFITISYRTKPLGYNWPDEKIKEVPLLISTDGKWTCIFSRWNKK